jgi:hypothetical protein
MHDCFDVYYGYWKEHGEAIELDVWLQFASLKWESMKMDEFRTMSEYTAKKFKALGGYEGAMRMLVQYYAFYMNERFRVVATEIAFGRNKEVFIGEFNIIDGCIARLVRCYLTGRIDLLVDTGNGIGPVDHKHTARFDGNEASDFNPHEGITGYIYAINRVLKTQFPEFAKSGKVCNKGWIFHISDQDANPRFKSSPIYKTNEQLNEYSARMLRSFRKLYEIVVEEVEPDWNTYVCHNLYYASCPYLPIHEQPKREQANIIKSHYVERITPWSPFNYGTKDGETKK